MMYKLYKTSLNEEMVMVKNSDGSAFCIPFDPDNTDYQAYLKWLAEGNQPLPADNNQ